jgi:hypothetical protein
MKTQKTELPNIGQVILNGLPKPKAAEAAKQAKPKQDKQVKKTKVK